MKSLSIFSLFLIVLLTSCAKDNPIDGVQLDPMDETVDPSTYMFEIYNQDANCLEDYMYLDIDGQTLEYYYNDPNNGIQLCTFNEGNVSGAMCDICEGHFASLPMPLSYQSYFPGLPVQVGGEFPVNNGTETITNINMTGLQVLFSIPANLTDNLLLGSYHYNRYDEFDDPGVSLYINWAVEYAGGSSGYTLYIDTNRPYEVALECIDRSNPDYIQLTGNFEGIFVANDLLNPTQIGYEIPMSGRFSYKISL